jgi:ADP-ribose pyrophosphatase
VSKPPEPLDGLPKIVLRVARDHTASARATGGFLNLRRLELQAAYPDGSESEPFAYDIATRASLDAAVIAAHFRDARGERHVFLRSALRPPLAMREVPPEHDGSLWELPAGLIDEGESDVECAARELAEELGIQVSVSALAPLGPFTFPAPGMIGERHVYFHVEVDPRTRGVPSEDGSPLERAAAIVSLSLEDALAGCRAGIIRDGKTEIALRRLAELTS